MAISVQQVPSNCGASIMMELGGGHRDSLPRDQWDFDQRIYAALDKCNYGIIATITTNQYQRMAPFLEKQGWNVVKMGDSRYYVCGHSKTKLKEALIHVPKRLAEEKAKREEEARQKEAARQEALKNVKFKAVPIQPSTTQFISTKKPPLASKQGVRRVIRGNFPQIIFNWYGEIRLTRAEWGVIRPVLEKHYGVRLAGYSQRVWPEGHIRNNKEFTCSALAKAIRDRQNGNVINP